MLLLTNYYFIFIFIDILPQSRLAKVFGDQTELKQNIPGLEWMLKYLTHIEFRGILVRKGYVVCLKRSLNKSE